VNRFQFAERQHLFGEVLNREGRSGEDVHDSWMSMNAGTVAGLRAGSRP
jgi:hypothetical protein